MRACAGGRESRNPHLVWRLKGPSRYGAALLRIEWGLENREAVIGLPWGLIRRGLRPEEWKALRDSSPGPRTWTWAKPGAKLRGCTLWSGAVRSADGIRVREVGGSNPLALTSSTAFAATISSTLCMQDSWQLPFLRVALLAAWPRAGKGIPGKHSLCAPGSCRWG